jgi:hypothetical protein
VRGSILEIKMVTLAISSIGPLCGAQSFLCSRPAIIWIGVPPHGPTLIAAFWTRNLI